MRSCHCFSCDASHFDYDECHFVREAGTADDAAADSEFGASRRTRARTQTARNNLKEMIKKNMEQTIEDDKQNSTPMDFEQISFEKALLQESLLDSVVTIPVFEFIYLEKSVNTQ